MTRIRQGISTSRGWLEILLVLLVVAGPTLLFLVLQDSMPGWLGTILALSSLPAGAVLSWLLMHREGPGAAGLGLGRSHGLSRTVGLGVLAGVGMLALAILVITPLVTRLVGPWIDPAALDPLRGNVGALLTNVLLVSWLHAALCEEIIFRGFLFQRFEQVLGSGRLGLAVAVLLQGALFGIAHYPQGVAGVVATAIGGCLWALCFLWARRNLWVVIVGHAMMDTVLFVLVFLGKHRLVLPG